MTKLSKNSANSRPMFSSPSVTFLISLISLVTISGSYQAAGEDLANGADMLGLSVAQIAELRRYTSEEHYVTTTDGRILQVTRIRNPLITDCSRKLPVLLIHGLISYGTTFVTNSVDARPRDHSKLNAGNMSTSQLQALLANEPSAKSIAFLASNFGHEVWILNRRGYPGSRGRVGNNSTQSVSYNSTQANAILTALSNVFSPVLPDRLIQLARTIPGYDKAFSRSAISDLTFDPKDWNYSLDEQAKYDIPEVTDYVLKVTNQTRLNAIGHSFGGALILMSLIKNPELNKKIANPILWAPALYIDTKPSNPHYSLGAAVSPFIRNFDGPFFPDPINRLIIAVASLLSATKLTAQTFVAPLFSFMFGPGSDQQNLLSGMFNFYPSAASAHEFNHLYQVASVGKGRMHTYDFGSASANQAAYGSPTPILYDASKITNTNMSFWYGNTDTVVRPETIFRMHQDLTVPYNANLINGTGIFFNHQQFFNHVNVSNLLNIPTLQRID